MKGNWEKPTPTSRFKRWFDRLTKKHVKNKNWDAINTMHEIQDSLQYTYQLAYQQGVRDAKSGRV